MTTETKKKIIRFCKSPIVDKILTIYFIIILALIIMKCFLKFTIPFVKVLVLITIFIIIMDNMRKAVARRKDEIIYKNNLLIVVLSSRDFLEEVSFWALVFISTLIAAKDLSILTCIFIGIIFAIFLVIVMKRISRFFEEKLSE